MIRESKVTWFVNNNWAAIVSFLLTIAIGLTIIKIKNSNKKIRIANPKGGDFIGNCNEPGSAYEVLDPVLKIMVKGMLDLRQVDGPIIIGVPALIISYIVLRQPIKQIGIAGVELYFGQVKELALKSILGTALGIAVVISQTINVISVISVTSFLLATAIAYNIAQGTNRIECDALISKIPVERIFETETVDF
jgi:energy-coupling factor transporter transmembrane protein EcfT